MKPKLLISALPYVAWAQFDPYSPFVYPNRQGLAPFKASAFGLFVHWGPVSQWGTEISFPLTCTSFPCSSSGPGNTAITINNVSELAAHREAYAQLATTFNPTQFDPSNMADLAYAAGMRYLTWVGTHCDGFSNWNSTVNKAYSIVSTPYEADTFAAAQAAFKAKGMRTGVYVCPSFWNNDNYFYPNATTSFGTCCQPNYSPVQQPGPWGAFTTFLHTELTELATTYKPDHYWIDSGTYPPAVDTHIELILPQLRAANPEVVVQVRDGGVWHDYVETVDHSENDAHALLGMSYLRPGDPWEVPGTLGQQWAFDPHAVYKDAPTVIRSLIGVIAKGGNYLLNIGPDSTGVWAPAAVDTLTNMSVWMAFSGESVHNTTPVFPYEYFSGPLDGDDGLAFTAYYTRSLVENVTYAYLVPQGAMPVDSEAILPSLKPSLLVSLPKDVKYLSPTGPVSIQFSLDETGLHFNASQIVQPAPVMLGTYFFNYSAPHGEAGRRVPHPEASEAVWSPVPWWKRERGTSAASVMPVDRAGARQRVLATGGSSVPHITGVGQSTMAVDASGQVSTTATLAGAGQGAAVVDHAPCGLRGCSVYTAAGYVLQRYEGVCYASANVPGGEPSVKLELYYNGADDNMGSTAGSPPSDGQAWQDVDSECYVYAGPGQQPGARWPVEVWHSTALGEYWTLANPGSRADAQAQGYTRVRTVGYIDTPPPGGFGPAEQAALASSYAYVLRLEW